MSLPQIQPVFFGSEIHSFAVFASGAVVAVVKADRIGVDRARLLATVRATSGKVGRGWTHVIELEGRPQPRWLQRLGDRLVCAHLDESTWKMRFHPSTGLVAYCPNRESYRSRSTKRVARNAQPTALQQEQPMNFVHAITRVQDIQWPDGSVAGFAVLGVNRVDEKPVVTDLDSGMQRVAVRAAPQEKPDVIGVVLVGDDDPSTIERLRGKTCRYLRDGKLLAASWFQDLRGQFLPNWLRYDAGRLVCN